MAAIAVSLGSMIIGFGSGYTSTALPSMTAEHNSSLIIDSEGHEVLNKLHIYVYSTNKYNDSGSFVQALLIINFHRLLGSEVFCH
jgi:hypothetical protein